MGRVDPHTSVSLQRHFPQSLQTNLVYVYPSGSGESIPKGHGIFEGSADQIIILPVLRLWHSDRSSLRDDVLLYIQ